MFTCTGPVTAKHGKLETFREGLPPINSHNPLNLWSGEVTLKIKTIISPLPQRLWSQDLAGW